MKESIFVTEIVSSLKEQIHPHLVKIPDMPKFKLRSIFSGKELGIMPEWIKNKMNKLFYRFSPPRPYDLYFVFAGKFYAIECKIHKKKQAIPFSIVSDYQVEQLKDVVNNGSGYAYVLINIRIERKLNKAYAIPVLMWAKWKEDYNTYLRRKSIPIDSLKNYRKVIELEWLKRGKWNIKPLLMFKEG